MNVLTVTGRLTVAPVRRHTNGVVCPFRLAVESAGQGRSPHDKPAAPIGERA